MVDYNDSPYKLDEHHGVEHSYDLANTLRSFNEEIRICKADNGKIMQAQEKQAEVNAILL